MIFAKAGLDMTSKLRILSDAAKYDVACTSSGVDRKGKKGTIGNAAASGICHAFSADGRCISLLKILFTNECIFDCKYCINRRSSDVERATFTPREVAELTMDFYRRNYIEGLFLSSGIIKNPDYTMEQLCETLLILRKEYHFNGYIHVKAIPGADPLLIQKTGFLADRMSVNLELPTAEGLSRLAPNKNRKAILKPMRQIQMGTEETRCRLGSYGKNSLAVRQNTALELRKEEKLFVPAGQSSQMIIGATPESDYQILMVAESLYQKFSLKRVFYSAFINTTQDSLLPVLESGPPLLREHRLYQADWLLRFYGFSASELLTERQPNFNVFLDPKCNWALGHLELFPVEVNKADYYTLLRVPGIGVNSARRIVTARRAAVLDFPDLKKMGVVLKRAQYFITCSGRMLYPVKIEADYILNHMLDVREKLPPGVGGTGVYQQLNLFDDFKAGGEGSYMKYIYICEETADGIFTGIYEAWASRLGHGNIRLETEQELYEQELFCEYKKIETDSEKALKVARSIERKIGREAYELVYRCALSGKPGRADDIYRFLILGFAEGHRVLEHLSHPYVSPVFERNRNVTREFQHYQGFVRFSELANGILFSEIRPVNDILALLGEHFSDRFSGENWIIFEAGRRKAALHRENGPFVLMEISGKEELLERLGVQEYSEREAELQGLWKEFVDSIGIQERANEKLQKQMLPKRYREFMREYTVN